MVPCAPSSSSSRPSRVLIPFRTRPRQHLALFLNDADNIPFLSRQILKHYATPPFSGEPATDAMLHVVHRIANKSIGWAVQQKHSHRPTRIRSAFGIKVAPASKLCWFHISLNKAQPYSSMSYGYGTSAFSYLLLLKSSARAFFCSPRRTLYDSCSLRCAS